MRTVSTVDSVIAGGLVKLEDKYPVVSKQPSEVSNSHVDIRFYILNVTIIPIDYNIVLILV